MRKLIGVAVAALFLLHSSPARATQYEIYIDIENEEDLYDLLAARQIGEDTFNTLLELIQRGVNLNTANREELYALPNLTYAEVDRIIAYRNAAGFIADPAVLVLNKVLTKQKFVAIAAFLVIKERKRALFATTGRFRAQTVWTNEDARVPATAMSLRVSTLKNVNIGVLGVVTRNTIGAPIYDPNRNALVAGAAGTRVDIPKFYAQWEDGNVNVIVGNFTAGFGERLVFDTTPLYTPNGIYVDNTFRRTTDLTRKCKLSAGELGAAPCDTDIYVTPDFDWFDYLFGVAAGIQNVKLGPGTLQAYGFFSYQPLDVYQYQLYDKNRCSDPRNDSDPNCSAPDVFVRGSNLLAPAAEHSFQTLPNIMRELTVGGNIAYRPRSRVMIGVTGYGSTTKSLAGGLDLDWQEWATRNFGGPYGAVGVNGAVGDDWLDVFFEVARSFDSMEGGGGGLAGVGRAVATKDKQELELSVRYYGSKFANPFAGSYAQPDTLDGLRDRDEMGARVRYAGILQKKLNIRGHIDVWKRPSLDRYKAEVRLRADIQASKIFGYGLWLEYDDRDVGGSELVCDVSAEELTDTVEMEPVCGKSYRAAARISWSPHKKWRLFGQYQHVFNQDLDAMGGTRYRQDVNAWLNLFARVAPELGVRARVRYLFQDISDNTRLEQSIWFYLNMRYTIGKRQWLQLRYDVRRRLDERASTMTRVPRTESWLWASYENRF